MSILLLDELYFLRENMFARLCREYKVIVITDSMTDFFKLPNREEVKILAFSSSFFNWELPNEFLDLFPNLKGICLSGSWYEHVDLHYCSQRQIKITNVPGLFNTAAAEWCIMASFILARNVPLSICSTIHHRENVPGIQLAGKTAGIIGLGGVGREVSKLARTLGMDCIYWSRKSRDPRYKYHEIDYILRTADFVFLTFYEAKNMKGFIDKKRLSLLRSSSFLISGLGSQPGLESDAVDWPRAIEIVQKGKLKGLAIEVGEGERINFPSSNIYIAPGHSGWCTKETIKRGTKNWIKNIKGIFDNSSPNIISHTEDLNGH